MMENKDNKVCQKCRAIHLYAEYQKILTMIHSQGAEELHSNLETYIQKELGEMESLI